jgi:hypothetical protein
MKVAQYEVLDERFGRALRPARDDRKDFFFGSNGVNVPRSSLAGRGRPKPPSPSASCWATFIRRDTPSFGGTVVATNDPIGVPAHGAENPIRPYSAIRVRHPHFPLQHRGQQSVNSYAQCSQRIARD